MLTGARSFEGRRTPLGYTFAGTLIWLAASQFESFSASPSARIVLLSGIIGGYLMWCAAEVWHANESRVGSRPRSIRCRVMARHFGGGAEVPSC